MDVPGNPSGRARHGKGRPRAGLFRVLCLRRPMRTSPGSTNRQDCRLGRRPQGGAPKGCAPGMARINPSGRAPTPGRASVHGTPPAQTPADSPSRRPQHPRTAMQPCAGLFHVSWVRTLDETSPDSTNPQDCRLGRRPQGGAPQGRAPGMARINPSGHAPTPATRSGSPRPFSRVDGPIHGPVSAQRNCAPIRSRRIGPAVPPSGLRTAIPPGATHRKAGQKPASRPSYRGLTGIPRPGRNQARSNRSAFITLFQAFAKSRTNFSCASSWP